MIKKILKKKKIIVEADLHQKKELSNKELLSALFLTYIPAIITIYLGNATELAYFISSTKKTKFTAEFFYSLNEIFNKR